MSNGCKVTLSWAQDAERRSLMATNDEAALRRMARLMGYQHGKRGHGDAISWLMSRPAREEVR